jgi:hypothetical protein
MFKLQSNYVIENKAIPIYTKLVISANQINDMKFLKSLLYRLERNFLIWIPNLKMMKVSIIIMLYLMKRGIFGKLVLQCRSKRV